MLVTAMWSNLRKILAERCNDRPKRRGSLPHFRGQFEPLESRTVLSATIGMMALDVEANTVTVAIWEAPSNPPAWLPQAPDLDAPPLAFGPAGGGWRPDGGERFFHQNSTGTPDGLGIPAGNIPEKSPLRATAPQNDSSPIRATAPPEVDTATGALTFNPDFGNAGGFVNSAYARYHSARTIPSDALAYTTAPAATSTPTPALATTSTLAASDAAFDKYVSYDLLLTTAVEMRDGKSLDDTLGEDDSLPDEQPKTDAGESFATEEVVASLDALQRERHAIDEVLAELHDVTPNEKTQHESTEIGQHRPDDTPAETPESYSADQRTERQLENTPADGMVLLQPTGDANSSAYDLTDVYFARLGGDNHAPLAVETSIGMYQAIDVGQQPAANRAQLPVAEPDQAVRPSVSAENAPAKKSEQPS